MQEKNPTQSQATRHQAHGVLNTPLRNDSLKAPLMRKIESKNNTLFFVASSLVVVLLGIGTGWFLAGGGTGARTATPGVSTGQKDAVTTSDTEAGMEDTTNFPDTATGKLVKGGIEGEGTYHLERDGGPAQNVYLTSTVIDLASFEGKKVQVWGQSLSGKKAGWLMDVGKVKVVE